MILSRGLANVANRTHPSRIWSVDVADPHYGMVDLYDMDCISIDGIVTSISDYFLYVSDRDTLLVALMVSRAVLSRILWIVPQSMIDQYLSSILLVDRLSVDLFAGRLGHALFSDIHPPAEYSNQTHLTK
jgi:hypothetical protein